MERYTITMEATKQQSTIKALLDLEHFIPKFKAGGHITVFAHHDTSLYDMTNIRNDVGAFTDLKLADFYGVSLTMGESVITIGVDSVPSGKGILYQVDSDTAINHTYDLLYAISRKHPEFFSNKGWVDLIRTRSLEETLVLNRIDHIKAYVKEWMDGHEPDTFIKDEHGRVMYSCCHSSLNLTSFFEDLLESYVNDSKKP